VAVHEQLDRVQEGACGGSTLEAHDVQEAVVDDRALRKAEDDAVNLDIAGNQHHDAPAHPVAVHADAHRRAREIAQREEAGDDGGDEAEAPLAFQVRMQPDVHRGVEADAAPQEEMAGRGHGPAGGHAAHIDSPHLAGQQETCGLEQGPGMDAARHGQIELAGEDVAGAAGQDSKRSLGIDQAVHGLCDAAVAARQEHNVAAT